MRTRFAIVASLAVVLVARAAAAQPAPSPLESKGARAQRGAQGFSVMAKSDRVLLFASYPDRSCTIDIKGRYGGTNDASDHPIVVVDGEMVEFNVLPIKAFMGAAAEQARTWPAAKLLAAHITWDASYIEKHYRQAKILEGDLKVTLGDHLTPSGLYYATWEFGVPPEKAAAKSPSSPGRGRVEQVTHRLFAETVVGSRVVILGTMVTHPAKLDASRRHLADVMESIKVSDGSLNIEQLQRDFAR